MKRHLTVNDGCAGATIASTDNDRIEKVIKQNYKGLQYSRHTQILAYDFKVFLNTGY